MPAAIDRDTSPEIKIAQPDQPPKVERPADVQTYIAPAPILNPEPVKAVQDNQCNPNYSGCLRPDASDYDCAGGSGNGPYYTGVVQVLGYDEFDLDRDNDGLGCE